MQKQMQIQKNITNHKQQGLGTIFVIIILVILAGLAAGIVWISRQQQLVIADDVRESKINQLALAALEWGKSKAMEAKPFTDETGSIKICDPSGDNSLSATVKIKTTTYVTVENVKRYITKINAVACSATCGSECNNENPSSNYREKYVETILDYCEIDTSTNECKVNP